MSSCIMVLLLSSLYRQGGRGQRARTPHPAPPRWYVVEPGFSPGAQQALCFRPQVRWVGHMGLKFRSYWYPPSSASILQVWSPPRLSSSQRLEGIGCFISASVGPCDERMAVGPKGSPATCERRAETKLSMLDFNLLAMGLSCFF